MDERWMISADLNEEGNWDCGNVNWVQGILYWRIECSTIPVGLGRIGLMNKVFNTSKLF